MKITFITIADMGKISNLKTRNSIPIFNAIRKIDPSAQIICRDYKNFNYKNKLKILPFGNFVPKIFTFINNYLNFNNRRFLMKILDFFASEKIRADCNLLIVIPTSFPKAIKKVKSSGGQILICEDVAHPQFTYEIMSKILRNDYIDNYHLEAANLTDYVLTFSEFSKSTYVKNGFNENKIFACSTGTDIDKFKSKKKSENIFRVICVANYNQRKGVQYLLEAWEKLKLKKSELIIVGTIEKEMKIEIKKYKKNKSIKFINFTKDIVSYYQQSSVFVLPSLLEGSARVIYEAMACELPIICTYESGSVVRDGKDGFIIKSKSVNEIKEKLNYFYENPNVAVKMGKSGRKLIEEKYQWKHFGDRVYKVLKEIEKNERIK